MLHYFYKNIRETEESQKPRTSGFWETFAMPFFTKTPGGITHLVVGLGNPDKKYLRTRHNAGFIAVDEIAASLGASIDKKKFDALVADVTLGGERALLMKPQTYMNLSGVAVEKAASFYKIPPEKVIVLFDDISLDVGRVRIRRKGSHGGHNGIRSIVDYLQSENFPRVKIGVGERPNPNYDLADWVLSVFTEEEMKGIREVSSHCREIVELILQDKIDQAMNRYNS